VIDLLTRNLGWKIFSLLVSLLLWFFYARDPEVGAFVSVPVEYRGMPDNLEISSDLVGAVSIDLRGPSEKVANFSAAKSAVVLDFSGIRKPGEQTFQIDERDVTLPSGMRLERAIPAQIRLQFERRTEQDVPVEVRFAGVPPDGFQLKQYSVEPETLTLVGPESRVRKIEHAVTDPIDLTAATAGAVFRVNAFVGDPHVRFAKPVKIAVRVEIQEKQ
jgi:YbbR domain-containing protein